MDSLLSHRLLTAEQMQRVDKTAAAQGLCTFTLMQRAGAAVAQGVRSIAPAPCNVLIIAGPGNNGGDGAVAAVNLLAQGYEIEFVRVGVQPAPGSDVFRAFELWEQNVAAGAPHNASTEIHRLPSMISNAAVIVDAMFGAGLSRPLSSIPEQLVDMINGSSTPVVAVDVPSGLDGNSHAVQGVCVQATLTVTFFLKKPAHVLFPGRQLCGQVLLSHIGLSADQLATDEAQCWTNQPALFIEKLPQLQADGHKFQRGHVLVRSGPVKSTGAARLSAETAIHSGAGLVTLATSTEALATNAAHLTAVMLQQVDTSAQWIEALGDPRINTVVLGPGNGVNEKTRDCVINALESDKHCVLDADALSCWQDTSNNEKLMQSLNRSSFTAVLTPHAGEFKRVFGDFPAKMFPSKLHQTREAARRTNAVVVFKGADTVIAAPDGRASVNDNAPPWLATAGAGDVLAGLIAALMAQGTPAFEAACAGVWLHGCAGNTLSYPLCAEDLVRQVGKELGGITRQSR